MEPLAAAYAAPGPLNTPCQIRSLKSRRRRLDPEAGRRRPPRSASAWRSTARFSLVSSRLRVDVAAEGGVLQVAVAAADADLDAAAAEGVDDRDVLGQPDRVLQRQDRDRGAEPDPRGAGRRVGEERPRRRQAAAAVRHVVLGDPADVEAELVGDDEQLLGVAVRRGQVVAATLDVGEEAEPETRGVGALVAHHALLRRPRRRRLALLGVSVGRDRQAEVAAQGVGLVLGAEQAALLQDRHHAVDEASRSSLVRKAG